MTKPKSETKGRKAVEVKAKKLKALEVRYVKHTQVVANSYNPNRQSDKEFELLKRSMEEDGFTQPIIVVRHPKQRGKFRIVDGEHRWRCAIALGYAEVPIVITPMTFEQAKIATLRHNRARGSEDIELTAQVLKDLQEVGAIDWAQKSLMMDDVEMNKLLDDISVTDALADEDYSEAWVPTDVAPDDTVEGKEYETGDGKLTRGMSPEAVKQQRAMEKKMAAAKTEEERQMVAKDSRFYRVNLVFADAEADLVKKALGNEPAKALVAMCKA